ncbi:UNVERIFIED_CONTAM: Copia protein [Sesamum radiatum]|uniref:Copia protein n=1 Tax=Sesamum radiatum TaxID=300843 RepID=A0AAW2W4A2_SESRA
MNYTRPDIAYVVSRLSRYTHNLNKEHWGALCRLLRYLKGTMNLCLHFNKYTTVLEGFCDANWVTDNDEVSSLVIRIRFWVGERYLVNLPKKRVLLALPWNLNLLLLNAGQEAEWLRNLVGDIPLCGSSVPVSLHCNSQAAIRFAKNYVYNGKRRHICIRHDAVKELLKKWDNLLGVRKIRKELG